MGAEPENYIGYAVPLFAVAMLVEIVVARLRQQKVYRFGPAISDLGTGMASQVAEAFLRWIHFVVFAFVYDNFRFINWESGSPWPWVIAFVGVDLGYYCWHRASHVINSLWAVHGVHHQSEEYNLAVALRQPALESLSATPFYLPLAFLGIDPVTYAIVYASNLSFQFFIHTELVDKLGFLESFLNTPSHHRVHHGINPRYLDKNYGGVLVIWDKLFGTFEPEDEKVVYGVTKPLRSFNPLWANLQHFAFMWEVAGSARRLRDKLYVIIAHPAWRPDAPMDEAPAVSRETFVKYDPRPLQKLKRYALGHLYFSFVVSAGFSIIEMERGAKGNLVVPAIVFVAGLIALGGLAEGRRWAWPLDVMRQLGLLVVTFQAVSQRASVETGLWATTAAAAICTYLLVRYRPWAHLTVAPSKDPASARVAAQNP